MPAPKRHVEGQSWTTSAGRTEETTMSDTTTIRVRITGRVQGVWYRGWTVDHARRLGLSGWVRNRRDGSVEAVLSGPEQVVRSMVELCRRGFAGQMVLSQDASCYIDWIDPAVLSVMPQWHYLHIGDEVLPYLKEHGVTDEQLEMFREEVFEINAAFQRGVMQGRNLSAKAVDAQRRSASTVSCISRC